MTGGHDPVIDKLALLGAAEMTVEADAGAGLGLSSGIRPCATLRAWLAPTA
ncbi:hypothetical protein [Sphingopyxis sp. BSNA05]|uniref:hypothetical protein n=1 Tax=Sphingopyxis sp. BSNA05 TaxID=1236614 RepID=UPI00349F3D12